MEIEGIPGFKSVIWSAKEGKELVLADWAVPRREGSGKVLCRGGGDELLYLFRGVDLELRSSPLRRGGIRGIVLRCGGCVFHRSIVGGEGGIRWEV